jgi:hypothetical protein
LVEVNSADGDHHTEVHTDNTIKFTKEQLSDEQRQQLAEAVKGFEDECLLTFGMVGREGKVIKKTDFPTPRRITVTEDSAKFQEMFDQAMHHALINQSKVMMNSVQNAIYEMMKSIWTPGYTGPCYSQSESSAAAADREAASAAAGIGSQPMAPSTAPAGTGPIPMLQPFFQPTTFQPVGTPMQSAPRYTTASPMATSASRNLFSTPSGYVPTSSFGMPSEMMADVWPQSHSTAG